MHTNSFTKKKRLLIVISLSNSIRYIIRTKLLYKIREFCEPVVVFTWEQADVMMELQNEGFEVYVFPEGKYSAEYLSTRRKIDIWFDHFALPYPSKKIERRYLDHFAPLRARIIRKIRENYTAIKLLNPAYRRLIFEKEKSMLTSETNYQVYENLLNDLNIEAVFTLTPFHRQEDILLRVCKERGLTMITAILSFDNITKRGWIPVDYDVYMVWNKYNQEELHAIYPMTRSKPVEITGAPQFDFYFDKHYLFPEDEWRKRAGVADSKRKIILYAGGPKAIFPNEPQYLKHLNEAINKGDIRNKPLIYFRCHPIDRIERWVDEVGVSENIIYDISWTGEKVLYNANVSDNDIMKLCSTLAYTDVHINLCSTMTVDGSAFGKPQIAPYYDEVNMDCERDLRNLFLQQHFLPIIRTGGLQLAHSRAELIKLVNTAIDKEDHFNEGSEAILKEIITYTDGNSTDRVIKILAEALVPGFQNVPMC